MNKSRYFFICITGKEFSGVTSFTSVKVNIIGKFPTRETFLDAARSIDIINSKYISSSIFLISFTELTKTQATNFEK